MSYYYNYYYNLTRKSKIKTSIDYSILFSSKSKSQIPDIQDILLLDPFSNDSCGRNLLHWASMKGHLQLVSHLLNSSGINPFKLSERLDNKKRTSFHYSVINGHLEVVSFYLEFFKDKQEFLFKKDFRQRTPIHTVILKKNTIMYSLLLKEQFSNHFMSKDRDGNTPAHFSTERGDFETVSTMKELLRDKFNPMIVNNDGKNLLHLSVLSKTPEIIVMFVDDSNFDATKRDNSGNTILDYLSMRRLNKLFTMFYQHLPKNKPLNSYFKKNSPLHYAASHGNLELVSKILNYFDPELELLSKNHLGSIPIHIAVMKEDLKSLNLF